MNMGIDKQFQSRHLHELLSECREFAGELSEVANRIEPLLRSEPTMWQASDFDMLKEASKQIESVGVECNGSIMKSRRRIYGSAHCLNNALGVQVQLVSLSDKALLRRGAESARLHSLIAVCAAWLFEAAQRLKALAIAAIEDHPACYRLFDIWAAVFETASVLAEFSSQRENGELCQQ